MEMEMEMEDDNILILPTCPFSIPQFPSTFRFQMSQIHFSLLFTQQPQHSANAKQASLNLCINKSMPSQTPSLIPIFILLIYPPPSLSFSLSTFMAASSSLLPISPRKLRSDLYSLPTCKHPDAPLVISVLASLIDRTIARNERIAKNWTTTRWPLSRAGIFESSETPDLTIQCYLERIFRYTGAAAPVFVVAYVYIDRFCQNHPKFRIAARNVHRLLITTVMLASKYVEDMNYRNSYFASVGGITTKEMNKLEVEFLFMMEFKLHVNVSVFESYCCHLEREVSFGGGYHVERTLRCAQEIKSRQKYQTRCLLS
ncbi:cyclin-U2-2-like [Diospyros lotus]|uniref:cyclin-U2-2-like n=1 Tax=Diospyros lotus TaxID=55363 RepID=UPI00224FFECE|nr:cyclin-U2-2-like [Diospyros lotus]